MGGVRVWTCLFVALWTAEDGERGNSSCGEHMGAQARHSPAADWGIWASLSLKCGGMDPIKTGDESDYRLRSFPHLTPHIHPRTVTQHCAHH